MALLCKNKITDAGQLDNKVIIQTATTIQDDFGEETQTWEDTATMWASIQPISGREALTADAINSEVSHKIMMRYKAGVTPKNRILFGSRVFDINVARNIFEKNRFMELLCKEAID